MTDSLRSLLKNCRSGAGLKSCRGLSALPRAQGRLVKVFGLNGFGEASFEGVALKSLVNRVLNGVMKNVMKNVSSVR